MSEIETKIVKAFVAAAAVIYCTDWLLARYIIAAGAPAWLEAIAPDFARGAADMYYYINANKG